MKKIINILKDIRPDIDLNDIKSFLEGGGLDSLDVISLVSALETNFGVTISGSDIVPENFNSLAAIETLINKSKPEK